MFRYNRDNILQLLLAQLPMVLLLLTRMIMRATASGKRGSATTVSLFNNNLVVHVPTIMTHDIHISRYMMMSMLLSLN